MFLIYIYKAKMNSSIDSIYKTKRKRSSIERVPPPVRKKRRRKAVKRNDCLVSLVKDGLSPLRIKEGAFNICSPILSILRDSRDVSPIMINLQKRSFLTPNSSEKTEERPTHLKRFKNGAFFGRVDRFKEDNFIINEIDLRKHRDIRKQSFCSLDNSLINNTNRVSYYSPKSVKHTKASFKQRKESNGIKIKFNLKQSGNGTKPNLISQKGIQGKRSYLLPIDSNHKVNEEIEKRIIESQQT